MPEWSWSVLILLGSLLSMLAIVSYRVHENGADVSVIGGVVAYVGILPIFVTNAFDLAATVERTLILFGVCSLIVGLWLLWKTSDV